MKYDCVIVGGVESASLQPLRVYHRNDPRHSQSIADGIEGGYCTAQFSPESLSSTVMLEGAERAILRKATSAPLIYVWILSFAILHSRSFNYPQQIVEPNHAR